MASLPFVDTHVHFYDFSRADELELRWAWLEPDFVHPIIGNIDGIKTRRYGADEYLAETRFANVAKAIHVQAALGTPNVINETRWLQEYADRTGFPHGIVAECHLARDDAQDVLDQQAQYANVRGIRDFGEGEYLRDPAWQRGYRGLARHGWVYCLDSAPEVYHQAADLARAVPDVVLCLDHAGFPRQRDDDYFQLWQRELKGLAEAENAIVKVSGLGMCDPTWTVASWRPWVHACLEAFGPERTVLGTNWPVDRLFSSYSDVVDAYAELVSDLSEAEQRALFSENAERIFRI
jgi:predicted TIM-barrel fold metal-dependent hydrolase